MPEPTKTPSHPNCIIKAASAGVAIPPAAKLTTGSLFCSLISSKTLRGARNFLLRATISFSSHAITSFNSFVIVLICLTASTTLPVPASPFVLIIEAPSAILLVASPNPVAPHTNGALKLCLLI